MSSGPEHYAKAERVLAAATRANDDDLRRDALAEAQVHATLALVAAVVANRSVGPQEAWGGHAVEASAEWQGMTEQ